MKMKIDNIIERRKLLDNLTTFAAGLFPLSRNCFCSSNSAASVASLSTSLILCSAMFFLFFQVGQTEKQETKSTQIVVQFH